MRKLKNCGITLISLIVTIIILLILAGISIGLIAGSDGILGRASGAVEQNEEATATEKMELKITYFNMISYGENTRKATLQELADGLCKDEEMQYVKLKNQEIASLEPIDVTGESSIFVKLKEYPYEFEIDGDLHLASVDGVKVENSNTEEVEALKREIASLKAENERLKSENEMLNNSSNLEILEHGLLKWNGPRTYTFSKDYRSAIVIIGASNWNGYGQALVTPQLAKGTFTQYYNDNRIDWGNYSINGALIFMENIQENDIVTLNFNYTSIYAIMAVE